MAVFRNSTEIIDGAIAFTTDRLNALEKDLDHCLTEPLAPLPAIAYCFSTIDLMGALYKGNAMTRAPTTDQSKAFMMDFMKYSDVQATLLQKIFRHKVIHLATPKAVIEHDSKRIGWRYHHHSKPDHLKLNRFATTQNFQVTPLLTLTYDYEFVISIKDLQLDLTNAVVPGNSSGYIAKLKADTTLQRNFDTAIGQIYDPTQ